MANDIITTLHPENNEDVNLYPNIKKDNIPNQAVGYHQLDESVTELLDQIGQLTPSGVDTSAHILAFTENKGIYVGSDTNKWYYWNGTQYVEGGTYQLNVLNEGAVERNNLSDQILEELNQTSNNCLTDLYDIGSKKLNQYWHMYYKRYES